MDVQLLSGVILELQRLRRRDHWTRQQLEAHQTKSLHHLREYAYARSPFYQRFHEGLTDRTLQELPVLTKAMMMEQFDELVTDQAIRLEEVEVHRANLRGDERFLGRYWVNATSGSTGHPGIFLFNRSEWMMVLASFARAREWGGIKANLTNRVKTAFVASTTPWHMSARAGATLHSWWLPELRLAASEPLERIVERLNAWQPETLIAYASMARLLAHEQLVGRLQITPRTVFSSSEVLTDDTRRLIEQAWGKVLFNQYAATESGSLAAECDHHLGMHLFEDLTMVEVVDYQNRPLPPGVYGDKLLLTVLFNRTQPLIRYELNDSVRLASSPCPCGRSFALIDDIQGRMEDVLSFPARAGGMVAVQPLVFSQVMDMAPVSGWQVIQEKDSLHVLLSSVRGEFADEKLADTLRHALVEQGAVVPPIHVQRVSAIPRTANGKAPLIKSNFSRLASPSHTPT